MPWTAMPRLSERQRDAAGADAQLEHRASSRPAGQELHGQIGRRLDARRQQGVVDDGDAFAVGVRLVGHAFRLQRSGRCLLHCCQLTPRREVPPMVQAPTSSSSQGVDVAQLLEADREHLIHPLSHPADHAKPMVVVRGEGAEIVDRRRQALLRRALWPVERARRPRPHRAGPGRGRADVHAGLQQQLRRLRQRALDAPGREAQPARLPEPERGLLHHQRRRVERVGLQDGALLLEAAGQAGQGQDSSRAAGATTA